MPRVKSLCKTEKFWNDHPCDGEWETDNQKIFFRETREPYIRQIIRSNIKRDDSLLEIGCGQGVDLYWIASITKHATAIDLTLAATKTASSLIRSKGLKAKILQGNAEKLVFEDSSFDVVYSYGVLHHTPCTEKAIDEVYRVLKSGGRAVIMLYGRNSLQYPFIFVARLLTFPFRSVLGSFLSRERFKNSFLGTSLAELFGVPILKAYSERQVRMMFSDFGSVGIEKFQTGFSRLRMPLIKYRMFVRIIDLLEEKTRGYFGFYQIIIARK